MALLTHPLSLKRVYITFTFRRDKWIGKLIPRRCMVVSVGLILGGLSIPALMMLNFLPITPLLCIVSFALVATGGIMTLILCGEI